MGLTPDQINQTVSNVLAGILRESQLTQGEIAARSGMSPVTVQKLLSGKQAVKLPQFLQLVSATKCSPAQAMNRIEEAIQREESLMSAGVASLDAHREKKSPATMTDEEWNVYEHAANEDPEHLEDEPDAP